MVVVTDTSPINYLILTGYVDVLPGLHGEVVIPQAVARELRHPRTPDLVRQWIAAPPARRTRSDSAFVRRGLGQRDIGFMQVLTPFLLEHNLSWRW